MDGYTPAVPDLVPLEEAAAEFHVSQSSLYRWIREGLLERYRRRGESRTLIDRDQLRKVVEPRAGATRRDTDHGSEPGAGHDNPEGAA
jgi:hypothetical protein